MFRSDFWQQWQSHCILFDMTELRHGFVITQRSPEIRLHYVESNNRAHNPMVIFLHGFPEHWYSWRKYLTGVAEEGFHGVALDLRGYNESSRPLETSAYRIDHLVKDIDSVIRHFNNKSTYIVGHDWGGILTWEFARRRPEFLNGIVVINAPHIGSSFKKYLTKSLWPAMARTSNLKHKEKQFFIAAHEKKFLTHGEMQVYKEALSHPSALMTAIKYSRANVGNAGLLLSGKIHVPTLLIKGESNIAHEKELTTGMSEFFPEGLTKRFYPYSSHWVHLEHPREILNEILYFLSLTRIRGHRNMAVSF